MNDERFYKTVEQIKNLKEVKSVAYHIVEDVDDSARDIVKIRVETSEGEVIEIMIHNPYMGEYSAYLYNQEAVLIQLLLHKLYSQRNKCGNNNMMNVFFSGIKGVVEEINKVRRLYPYGGINWINEEQSGENDWNNPEWIL